MYDCLHVIVQPARGINGMSETYRIVGGLGSVLGSFFGAALILFAPIVLNNLIGVMASTLSLPISADVRAHVPLVLYGALIIGFLLWEPLGLAKIYNNVRNYLLVWPFRHAGR